jgi:hypothetical protein
LGRHGAIDSFGVGRRCLSSRVRMSDGDVWVECSVDDVCLVGLIGPRGKSGGISTRAVRAGWMGAEVGVVGVCHEKRCVCFAGLFGWWEVEGGNVMNGFGVLVLFYFSFFVDETGPC